MFDTLKNFSEKMQQTTKLCQITHYVSDLGLHCLALSLKKDVGLIMVKSVF